MSEWRPEYDTETHGRKTGKWQPPPLPGAPQQDYQQTSPPYGQHPEPDSGWQPTQPYGQPQQDPWVSSQAYAPDDRQALEPHERRPQQATYQQQQQPFRQRHRRPPAGRPGKWKLAAMAAAGIAALLLVISVAAQGGKGTPSGGAPPTANITAHGISTASPALTAGHATTAATSKAGAQPSPPPSPGGTQTTPAAGPSSPPGSSGVAHTTSAATPAQTSAAAAGCQPRSSAGQCYAVGDSCPAADHNQSGAAANGNAITCKNNHGWHWENS
jgi:hypothetical protein